MERSSRFEWSKDFVEHLRTVHFSLALLSFALLIAATNQQDHVVAKALTQIELIASVSKDWSANSRRIYEQILKKQRESEDLSAFLSLSIPEQLYPPKDFNQVIGTQLARISSKRRGEDWRFDGIEWPAEIVDLDDFKNLWNRAHRGFVAVVPDRNSAYREFVAALPEKGKAQPACHEYVLTVDEVGQTISPDVLGLPQRAFQDSKCEVGKPGKELLPLAPADVTPTFSAYKAPANSMSVFIKFVLRRRIEKIDGVDKATYIESTSEVTLPTHSVFADEQVLGNLFFGDWAKGDFETAFKELSTQSADIGLLKFDDAIRRIESKPESSVRTVSIFGATIELYQLSTWGAIVLVAVQLYFWLHLHELTQRISPDAEGWYVAWIGVYQSRLSLWLSTLSASVLPAATAAVLMIQTIRLHQSRWYICLPLVCCLLSTAIAIGTAVKITALRKERMVEVSEDTKGEPITSQELSRSERVPVTKGD